MGIVIDLDVLAEELQALRARGMTIVHCHGCFDLMHPGHILHFQEARTFGDILVITVTPDIFVDKGPGRPAFPQELRVLSLAALECVTYAAINKWATAEETLKLLKPHIYVKGQEFEAKEDRTGKLQKELAVLREVGAEIRFTHKAVYSSTTLLNRYFTPGKAAES